MASSSISWSDSFEIFAHRHLDVLLHGERGEQRALLEQHAPAPLDGRGAAGVELVEILAEDLDRSRRACGDEAEDRARQDRLARAGRADEAQDLAAIDVEARARS